VTFAPVTVIFSAFSDWIILVMTRLLRPLLGLLFVVNMAAGALAQTTDPAPDNTGLAADAVALPTEQTVVSVGAYVLRLNKVSPRDGSFDVDMWVWFRWLGTNVRPEQTFELANGIITNRTTSDITIDGGMNYTTVRVQGTTITMSGVFHWTTMSSISKSRMPIWRIAC
jgi:hypothetical protein